MDGKETTSTLLTIASAILLCACAAVTAEEEHQPEILLSPRNFNPHPYYYQRGYETGRPTGNTGPVLFPGGEGAPHPVDEHPYARVADKLKYKARGRFNHQDNRVNPNVYNALDAYAKKVLTTPASALKEYVNPSASNFKKNYKFSYKVLDHLTGDDFSHTQSQTGQATLGEYRVRLPDGRIQTVSYTADKGGYKAVVKYTEDLAAAAPQILQEVAGKEGAAAYFAVTAKPPPAYYDDYRTEAAYLGSKLAPYVVDGLGEGNSGTPPDEYGLVYEGEVYEPRQVLYRK